MRTYAVLAAAAGLGIAGIAKADFAFTPLQTDLGGGLTRTELFARITGTGVDVGSRALGSDVTLRDLAGHNLVTVESSDMSSADLTGTETPDPYHSDRSFVNLLGSTSRSELTAYSVVSTTPPNTYNNFVNGVDQFEVVGANFSGGVDATSAANVGRGALIAVIVAPSGDPVQFFGQIGGALPGSPAQSFDVVYPPIPEPTSVNLLGLGLGALLTRRRH